MFNKIIEIHTAHDGIFRTGRYQSTKERWWGKMNGDQMVFISQREFELSTKGYEIPSLDAPPF